MDADKFGSKTYCCSNSTRSEAKKLAIFDIIGSLAALAFASWTTEMVKNHTEYFKNITELSNATLTDLGFLLDFEAGDQDFFFAGILLWSGWSIALGGTLLYAAQMLKPGLLKVWLCLTIIIVLLGLFAVVSAILFLDRKIQHSGTSGSAISAKKMGEDHNPALVIVSPSPDPDAVYTIQGQASQPDLTQDS